MGERIEKALKDSGKSMYQLSKETGIPQATLSDWRRGVTKDMGYQKTLKIAQALNVPADYFEQD